MSWKKGDASPLLRTRQPCPTTHGSVEPLLWTTWRRLTVTALTMPRWLSDHHQSSSRCTRKIILYVIWIQLLLENLPKEWPIPDIRRSKEKSFGVIGVWQIFQLIRRISSLQAHLAQAVSYTIYLSLILLGNRPDKTFDRELWFESHHFCRLCSGLILLYQTWLKNSVKGLGSIKNIINCICLHFLLNFPHEVK